MTKVRVWYKLNENSPSRVKVEDDDIVDDLRDAVKEKWGEHLACAAPELEVFAAGADPNKDEPLRPGKKLSELGPTTDENPLIVMAMKKINVEGVGGVNLSNVRRQQQRENKKRARCHQEDLDCDDIRRMRKELDELKGRDSFAVSYADYFNEKSAAGRVETWVLPVLENTSAYLPSCLQNSENLPKGSETTVIKPYWKELIQDNDILAGFKVGYEVTYLGTKVPDIAFFPTNVVVVTPWKELIQDNDILAGFKVGYEVTYLGTKVPDIAFFPTNVVVVTPNAGEFVAYGDCKGKSWNGTSASEMGQAMQYGHRILDAQPLRTHVYGFFANNERTMLIKTSRTGSSPYIIHWQISGLMQFDQGMATFFKLILSNNGFMLPPTVNNTILSIRRALRPGKTCRAFLSDFDGEEVVAKLFHNSLQVQDNLQKLLNAKAAVDASARGHMLSQVPTVRGSENVWLIITPYGTPFTPNLLKLDHVRMLVGTLEAVHGAGIVHRDVRFANIHLLKDDSVLLNDWGSSAPSGELQEVAGCPEPWNHPELRGVTECAPHPKHDLYSLVSSIGELISPGMVDSFRNAVFQKAMEAAENCDYEGVVNSLAEIIGS